MKEISYNRYLGGDGTDVLRIRIWTDKGKVVDLVVQYEYLIKEEWHVILRYDCAHGYFHRDVLMPNGFKEKQTISITSLTAALNYAEQDIKDRFEFYRERYLKKVKK